MKTTRKTMADTNLREPLEINAGNLERVGDEGFNRQKRPGLLDSTTSSMAGSLANILGAVDWASAGQNRDPLRHGTGVPFFDNILGKIRPLEPMPDSPRFMHENSAFQALQGYQASHDSNSLNYPGEDFGSMIERAVDSSRTAFSQNKGEAGKQAGLTGLAPLAAQMATEEWGAAADFTANEVVKGVVQFAPALIAAAASTASAPITATLAAGYFGIQALGAAQNQGRAMGMPVAQRQAYALSEGIVSGALWMYLPAKLAKFAVNLTDHFGLKMGSEMLKESMRDFLSNQVGKLANNHNVQNWIVMRANQITSQLMQQVFEVRKITLGQALKEIMYAGVLDALTLNVFLNPLGFIKVIDAKYSRGMKMNVDEALILQMVLETRNGTAKTGPKVVDGDVIALENRVNKIISEGNYTDNPKVLAWFEHLKTSLQQVHNEKGFLRIKGIDDVKQPLAKGQIYASPLLEKIHEKMPNKANKEQVEALLKEVPEEEIEFTGVREFLKGKEKITKEELSKFVQDNQIQIKEVVKNDKDENEIFESKVNERAHEIAQEKGFDFKDLDESDKDTVLQQAHEEMNDSGALGLKGNETKFGKYQIPGGKNYREVLLTLPYNEYSKIKDWKNAKEEKIQKFKSSHFDEPNILAHVRLNDRQTDLGKTLFVEEVQSDWHQQGREKGYKTGRSFEQIDKDLSSEQEGTTRASDLINELTLRKEGVADAPFKKTWHELAMKRVLKEALDKGYDAVAWTTGEQQAERYDLSKQVDKIKFLKAPDGKLLNLDVYQKGSKEPHLIGDLPVEKLADHVGKDLAQKIVDHKDNRGEFSGLDLKVGGEGMKTFYDSMLPSAVNKMVKKFGGRVDKTEIEIPDRTHGHKRYAMRNEDGEIVGQYETKQEAESILKERLKNGMKRTIEETFPPKNELAHSVDINPIRQQLAMKDKAKGLFGQGGFIDISGKKPEEKPVVAKSKIDTYLERKSKAESTKVKPVEGTGEKKPLKLAESVKESALEKGIKLNFEDLPESETMNMKEQAQKVEELINKDPEYAMRIAMGDDVAPQGLYPENVFTGVRLKAEKEGNVNVIRDLAVQSKVLSESKVLGQRIKSLDSGDKESATEHIVSLLNTREKKALQRSKSKTLTKPKKKITSEIAEEIKKTTPTKDEWVNFIASIKC